LSASMAAQLVWTPVDVISQRLMVQTNAKVSNPADNGSCTARPTPNHAMCSPNPNHTPGSNLDSSHRNGANSTNYRGGLDAFRTIIRVEGIRGLYRGFGMSILTYAPSSALWWASYCITQRTIWRSLGLGFGRESANSNGNVREEQYVPSSGLIVAVQGLSAACAGGVAAIVTTPLDTIKTRFQVMESDENRKPPTVRETLRTLLKEGGWKACYKGLGPRWATMSMSATTMITTYEFLKRMSAKQEIT
jgi:solute carrier family 25 protein 44